VKDEPPKPSRPKLSRQALMKKLDDFEDLLNRIEAKLPFKVEEILEPDRKNLVSLSVKTKYMEEHFVGLAEKVINKLQ